MNSKSVFVTGGTGYLGQKLIQELLARGHRVRALARPALVQVIVEYAGAGASAIRDFSLN